MAPGLDGSQQPSSNGAASAVDAHGSLAQRRTVERRLSSPLAPAFMVSAPGKVIVFGEHSVVHGKARDGRPDDALAAADPPRRPPLPPPSPCAPIST